MGSEMCIRDRGLSERADSVEESSAAIDTEPDYGSLIIDQGVDE